jgi:hypothetical protein
MTGLADAVNAVTQAGAEPDEERFDLGAPEPEVPSGASSSVLAAVRTRAAQLSEAATVDLALPGYDNLIGRYRAVSLPRIYGKGGQMRNPMGEDWGVGADALASGLEGLYGLTPDGETVPLYSDGLVARYDDDLSERLGLAPRTRTARAVLVALLGGGNEALGESRVWAHFLAYQAWLTDGGAQEVAEQAVGEQSTTA